jgi:NitT/TauT family transport system substrate-binding protein
MEARLEIHRRDFLRLGLAGATAAALVTTAATPWGAVATAGNARTLRIGHLPNLTHAHALVARALERTGKPFLEPRLGPGVVIEWNAYPAGTAAVESMFSGALDLTYAGPNPILNGYVRSGGADMRILSGAIRGGSALVVPKSSRLEKPADFRGKRLGTPALGNTQDVAARAWLKRGGLTVTQTGGEAFVVPVSAADQLALFMTGDLDAVWTAEPTVTRLLKDGNGRILVNEPDAVTTLLAATDTFVRTAPDLARSFVAAHQELDAWIVANPVEAKALVRSELKVIMGRTLSAAVIDAAWTRLRFDAQLTVTDVQPLVDDAYAVGLLRKMVDLGTLFPAVTS